MAVKVDALVDLHEDISYYFVNRGAGLAFPVGDLEVDMARRHGDLPKYRRAKATLIFAAIFPLPSTYSPRIAARLAAGYGFRLQAVSPRGALPHALEHFKAYYQLVRQYPQNLTLLLGKEQVDRADEDTRLRFLLALEGTEAVEDVDDLELLYRLGLRSLQLTWNHDTRYAASCMSKKDYGLTGEGEAVVERCNELGIILDVSHGSKKTVLEACAVSKLPVIVSHANYAGVLKHKRNLDDQMVEAVKASGGVVGATLIATTIAAKRQPTVRDFARHIIAVYRRFGDEVLAIGTDFFGLIDTMPPRGLESIDKVSNLWRTLLEMGMAEHSIRKLAGENALRVIRRHAETWRP